MDFLANNRLHFLDENEVDYVVNLNLVTHIRFGNRYGSDTSEKYIAFVFAKDHQVGRAFSQREEYADFVRDLRDLGLIV